MQKPTIITHQSSEQKLSDMKKAQDVNSTSASEERQIRVTFFDKIIKYSIYLLVFLMPLFFLPFSFEKVEYNKQILLWVLAGIAFLAWVARMLFKDKEIKFKKGWLSIAVFAYLIINLLVLIFSKDFNASLWGYFGRYSDSFVGLVAFCALYFTIVNNGRIFTNPERIRTNHEFSTSLLVKTFLISSFLAEVILILSAYGVIAKVAPWMAMNTMAGFKEGAAIFVVIILNFKFQILKKYQISNIKYQISLYLFISLSLLSLVILNFKSAWMLLIISMLLWMMMLIFERIKHSTAKSANVLLPLAVIFISLSFVFNIVPQTKLIPQIKSETRLSAKDSFTISAKSLKDNFATGSGQGSFLYDFSKFKPASFNNDVNWDFRFSKANNYVAELLATTGVLGLLGWLALSFLSLRGGGTATKQSRCSAEDTKNIVSTSKNGIALLTVVARNDSTLLVFGIIVLSFFFYSSTTLLLFTFWLMLAIETLHCNVSTREIIIKSIFEKFPEVLMIVDAVFIIVVLAFAGLLAKVANKYHANTIYAQISFAGCDEGNENKLLECHKAQAVELEKARNLDKKDSLYTIALARIYLSDLKEELKKAPSEQSIANVKDLMEKAVNNAVLSTDLSPNSVSAWELRASVYREIYSLAEGSEKALLDAFQKAVSLEPTNPVLVTELGKAYSRNEDFENAAKEFNKALELKNGYGDARMQLAIVKEKFGKASEAISDMQGIEKSAPDDASVKFELGRLQYNKGDVDEAIASFKKAIEIFPNYSNAIYSLGICYEKKGDKAQALAMMKKVLELNPGRQDIEEKIKELEE